MISQHDFNFTHILYCLEEGVLSLGKEAPYGMDVLLFIDGIEMIRCCEPDEYQIVHVIDE